MSESLPENGESLPVVRQEGPGGFEVKQLSRPTPTFLS